MGWKGKLTQSIPNELSRVERDAKAGPVKTRNSRVAHFGGKHVQVFVFRGSICTRPAVEFTCAPQPHAFHNRIKSEAEILVGPLPRDRKPRSMNHWSRPLLDRSG